MRLDRAAAPRPRSPAARWGAPPVVSGNAHSRTCRHGCDAHSPAAAPRRAARPSPCLTATPQRDARPSGQSSDETTSPTRRFDMHVPAVFRRLAQHRARPTPLLAAGLAAVAAAGLAAAQSGGQDVIHACVSKTGDVRIVDPNTACPKNQTALDWNRRGPPGPQGEPGEAATRLFATADDRGMGNPDVLDESRSTPGVTLEQVRPRRVRRRLSALAHWLRGRRVRQQQQRRPRRHRRKSARRA